MGPEFVMFAVMSGIGSSMAVACLAISHYVLDLTSPLADNVSANIVGLVLGTVFRFWAYRTHVFSGSQQVVTESSSVTTSEATTADATSLTP
jgi:putative flippase GtrA